MLVIFILELTNNKNVRRKEINGEIKKLEEFLSTFTGKTTSVMSYTENAINAISTKQYLQKCITNQR